MLKYSSLTLTGRSKSCAWVPVTRALTNSMTSDTLLPYSINVSSGRNHVRCRGERQGFIYGRGTLSWLSSYHFPAILSDLNKKSLGPDIPSRLLAELGVEAETKKLIVTISYYGLDW